VGLLSGSYEVGGGPVATRACRTANSPVRLHSRVLAARAPENRSPCLLKTPARNGKDRRPHAGACCQPLCVVAMACVKDLRWSWKPSDAHHGRSQRVAALVYPTFCAAPGESGRGEDGQSSHAGGRSSQPRGGAPRSPRRLPDQVAREAGQPAGGHVRARAWLPGPLRPHGRPRAAHRSAGRPAHLRHRRSRRRGVGSG